MLNGTTKTRLHIRSIDDGAGKVDSEIAELFCEMRQASGCSLEQLAHQFNTEPETINLLEQGQLSKLPAWNESSRVVFEYTNLLRLDPEPVLRRIMVQLPGDHPDRPRTQSFEPSYENLRSNVSAVMNRVPGTQADFQMEFQAPQNPQFGPGYADMKAVAPEPAGRNVKSPPRLVANSRKSGVFVFLLQFLLMLIILAAGYVMWLTVHDPQGYEALKSLAFMSWETLVIQIKVWLNI
ncbi:MAG: hypothetical protein GY927_12710 [bacterium]|nr:hypothetical protein [bacterium]